MLNTISSERISAFSLPLPEAAHETAAIESQDYSLGSIKAEQVYLSHLASYAARYYFNLCGYPVVGAKNAALDFIGRALSDSAAIEISGYGSFACIVVSLGATVLTIPAIALSTPAGYIAIEFDDDLIEATVVGFLPQTNETSVASSELRSLTELPDYLAQLNPATSAAIQLSRWWNRSIERGWTLVSEMATGTEPDPLLAFRSRQPATAQNIEESSAETPPDDGLMCRKTLSLSSTESTFSLALMMERFTQPNQYVKVLARLSPNLGKAYLPADVQLAAADESLMPFSSMRSRAQSPFIELKFRANPGDYFRLTVAFEGVTVAEDFIV